MINNNIKWIMVAIGVITCSMVLVAIDPQRGLINTFGEPLNGPLADVVARSWGMLITITGGLLIYGAFNPIHRGLVIVAACCSKIWFVILNLWVGQSFIDSSLSAVIFDTLAVMVLLWYLFTRKETS